MRAFFDSNVAVYRFAPEADPRKAVAESLFDRLDAAGGLVLSTQVLLETYNALVRRRAVQPRLALAAVQLLARYEVVAPSPRAAVAAAELAVQHQLSVWDAFIVQAALEADCDTLFSEDLQAGRRFGKLEVVNPFELRAGEALPTLTAPPPARKGGARAVRSARRA